MKHASVRSLLLACLILTACQSHRRQEAADRATATLTIMDQVALVDLLHEKSGDPPPRRFSTWQDYWQHHFGTLHFFPAAQDRANGDLRNVAAFHLAFVKAKRAELGLPPLG